MQGGKVPGRTEEEGGGPIHKKRGMLLAGLGLLGSFIQPFCCQAGYASVRRIYDTHAAPAWDGGVLWNGQHYGLGTGILLFFWGGGSVGRSQERNEWGIHSFFVAQEREICVVALSSPLPDFHFPPPSLRVTPCTTQLSFSHARQESAFSSSICFKNSVHCGTLPCA